MKQLRFSFSLLLATTILAFGLALAQQDDEGAPEDINQQFEELYNEGDVEALAELYTEDAVFYDADGTVAEGRDAIQELLQEAIDAGFTELSYESIEVEVLNDTAYQIGRYTLTNDEGEAFEGYNLSLLRRENGEWRIHRDFANFILPEQEIPEMDEETDEDDSD